MSWQTFFKKFGEAPVTGGIPSATLEDVYQAFKERVMEETCIDLDQLGMAFLEERK